MSILHLVLMLDGLDMVFWYDWADIWTRFSSMNDVWIRFSGLNDIWIWFSGMRGWIFGQDFLVSGGVF